MTLEIILGMVAFLLMNPPKRQTRKKDGHACHSLQESSGALAYRSAVSGWTIKLVCGCGTVLWSRSGRGEGPALLVYFNVAHTATPIWKRHVWRAHLWRCLTFRKPAFEYQWERW